MDLFVITGPTASGKTALSIELAKRIDGEIVNADSMQIYKNMDIGTAKPTMEERKGVPHHMIDVASPNENYSVARYCSEARDCISEIYGRGKTPILVGGTGLYIDSIVYNIKYSEVESDENYRAELLNLAKQNGNEFIYNMLLEIDPESANKIELGDTRRIIRALEVYHVTGETKTAHKIKSRQEPSPYSAKVYAINMDRQLLYERINKRVDIMFNSGLLDEVRSLINMGIDSSYTSMQAIGYKEVLEYLNGEITLDEAKDAIKQGSRRYAKRQLTWFRRNKDINWIDFGTDMINSILG